MTPTNQEVADRLVTALQSENPQLLGSLLGPDVRWGGEEETEQTCHSRGDVLAWYRQLYDAGVRAQVTETLVREQAVMLTMALTGRESDPAGPQQDVVHQVFHLEAGLVVDIRGYPQRGLALAWADTPTPRN
jgi:SnoaL-like domain